MQYEEHYEIRETVAGLTFPAARFYDEKQALDAFADITKVMKPKQHVKLIRVMEVVIATGVKA